MIRVHSYRRCPFAMRVRMTLHEKGIEFETVEENLKDFSEALRKNHPEAKVPVLLDGDTVIYESAVITEYIEDQFPSPSLMPQEASKRAEVRLWTHWCNHHFKHHVDHYKYGEHRSTPEDVQMAPQRLVQDLQKLENALSKNPFLMGESLTLADIHVFPFLRQLTKATPYFEPLKGFEACQKWVSSIITRPSFEKTMAKPKG